MRQLEQAIRLHIEINNVAPKPLVWAKTAEKSSPVSNAFAGELRTHDTSNYHVKLGRTRYFQASKPPCP